MLGLREPTISMVGGVRTTPLLIANAVVFHAEVCWLLSKQEKIKFWALVLLIGKYSMLEYHFGDYLSIAIHCCCTYSNISVFYRCNIIAFLYYVMN